MRYFLPLFLVVPILAVATPTPTEAQPAPRKLDLADTVSGSYEGSVVADTRGGSQSDVTITVRRISKNTVEILSDYARVPTVTIGLTRASDAILNARGPNNFLIQQGRDPRRLDLSIDGATLIVHKQ